MSVTNPFQEFSEEELGTPQRGGDPSQTAGSFSLIDPKNTVLYEGTEDAAVRSLQQKPTAEPTSAQRARETIRGADPDPFAEPVIETRPVATDAMGRTKATRELLNKYEGEKFDYKNRKVTLGEMRQGHYYYRELKDLFTKRGQVLDPNVDKFLRKTSLYLANEYPEDPMLERTAMTIAEIPKTLFIDAPAAVLTIGDTVSELSGRLIRNAANMAGLYSDKDMAERYGDSSKNPIKYFVNKFYEISDEVYGDGPLSSHNMRPHVFDLFREKAIEMPPDIAAIVMSTKNPDADFISYLTHYLVTGFTPAAAVTMVRKGLRNATHSQLASFAAARGIEDMSEMQGKQFGKLVDDFIEDKAEKRFKIPVVKNAVDNLSNIFNRGRIVQGQYTQARKFERESLEKEAARLSRLQDKKVTVKEVMDKRLRPLVDNYNKVWSNPASSQAERTASRKAMEDMALRNYMGRRFGIYDPIVREEALAEILFAMGAATYDYATKNNNYKGTDNAMSVVAGLGAIVAGQRAIPRGALQLEGYARETFLDTLLWLKNSSKLAPSSVLADTPEAARLRGERAMRATQTAFPPVRQVVLDQTAALEKAPIIANKVRYVARVNEQGGLERLDKNKRKKLQRIISAVKLSGVTDNVLDQIEKVDKYRTAWTRLTGDAESFDSSFAAIVALQPLMAIEDTTKTSLTGMLGGIKIEHLQKHMEKAKANLDILNQAKLAFDNLTPQRLKQIEGDEELVDFVNGLIEMKRQADSALGGTVNRLEIELNRLNDQFVQNQNSFKDRSGDISNAAATLKEMGEKIQKLKEDAGITPEAAGTDTRIAVAEEQVGTARQAVSELESAVRSQDTALSEATTAAEMLRGGLRTPRIDKEGMKSGPTITVRSNAVIRSYLEQGKPEKALFELALDVRNAKDSYFNREFANLYKGVEVDIDDSGFIGNIFAKWTEISYGEDLSTTMRKLAGQESIPSDLRPVVGAIETASGRKLDEYFESLGEDGPIARAEIIEQYRNQFGEDAPIYNWLMLNTLKEAGEIKEGLKWNLNDLDLLRRSLNNRASNLEGVRQQELLNLSENINETITSELRRAGGEAAVREREVLRTRYRDEVRGGMYESAIGKLVHEARSRAGGMLDEGKLIKEFDLNTTLYGDEIQFATFVEKLERFFGQPGQKVGGQAPKYTLTPETVVDNIRVGENLKAILTAMNHSAMLQSTALKNTNLKLNTVNGYTDMADTRQNLFKNITPLNTEAVNRLTLLDGRASELGGMFEDIGSQEFSMALQRLIESSSAVQTKFDGVRREINNLASSTRNVQKGIEELAVDAMRVSATSVFMGKGITNIDDFVKNFGQDDSIVTTLPEFFENLATALKTQDKYKGIKDAELVDQLKEAFYEQVIKKVRDETFGITGDPAEIVAKANFEPQKFVEFVQQNSRLIEALVPDKRVTVVSPEIGGNLGMLKENFVDSLSDFAETLQFLSVSARQQTPEGIMAYSTKALSPSSWISRIYAVDRNVVSPRYVITEALLVRLRMVQGNDLRALLRDPELLYYMDTILRTGNVLPKEANNKFNLALRRAIAHNVNEEKDPRKTGLDTQQQLEQFEQNIMAQSAGIGGDLVPQTRMPQ